MNQICTILPFDPAHEALVAEGNDGTIRFYETLGFSTEKRISMGKKIPENIPIP